MTNHPGSTIRDRSDRVLTADDVEAIAAGALQALATNFARHDLNALLDSFSDTPTATYAGSELHEAATGPAQLHALLDAVLSRDATYQFTFHTVRAHPIGPTIWILADGTGHEVTPGNDTQFFPYRICGLLTPEHHVWRWALLTGAEPTNPA